MKTETYRGVKLKVVPGKGNNWGSMHHFINGHDWGWHIGRDEDKALASMHGYIDQAIDDDPIVNGRHERYEDYWRPGYKEPSTLQRIW